MDNLDTTVYILLPDFSVAAGHVGGKNENEYRIDTTDGRHFFRSEDAIFYDEKIARAAKFMKRFKMMLRTGHSMDEAWSSESQEITDLAVKLWPEKLL